MSQSFEISYWWEKLSEQSYFFEMVDATKIFNSLRYFISLYQGQFIIKIQGHEACFDLRPDLSTIFEEIPLVLEKLTKDTESPVEFDFFEQGTDVGMLMERQDDLIEIRFETAPGSGMRFKFLPDTNISVPAKEFCEEWLQFMRAILDVIVEIQPDIVNDESYQQYQSRLEKVEEHIQQRANTI